MAVVQQIDSGTATREPARNRPRPAGRTSPRFVDRALVADRELQRYFWLDAAAEVVLEHPPVRRRAALERRA
jgi:hypothetical protein